MHTLSSRAATVCPLIYLFQFGRQRCSFCSLLFGRIWPWLIINESALHAVSAEKWIFASRPAAYFTRALAECSFCANEREETLATVGHALGVLQMRHKSGIEWVHGPCMARQGDLFWIMHAGSGNAWIRVNNREMSGLCFPISTPTVEQESNLNLLLFVFAGYFNTIFDQLCKSKAMNK